MKATVAFVVFVVGCGSVTQTSLLSGRDAEVAEDAGERVFPGGEDGGVDRYAPMEVGGTDGPFGGKYSVDIPVFVNEPPMRGSWNIKLGMICNGTMNVTTSPNGHGWALGGIWACAGMKGVIVGTHDWNTDVVTLSLVGNGGGDVSGIIGLTDGLSGFMTVAGPLQRSADVLAFVATHN